MAGASVSLKSIHTIFLCIYGCYSAVVLAYDMNFVKRFTAANV